MKFRLQTEVNSSGNLVFSKERYGKGFMYLAFDKNGNSRPVTKDWIIQNKDEIENVRVSGDTIAAVQTKKKIEDFGEKIGGAKKDFFTKKYISIEDINNLSDADRDAVLRKDKLWPKIKVEELIEKGYDKVMAWYVIKLREAVPAKPKYVSVNGSDNSVKLCQEWYLKFVMALKKRIDVDNFKESYEISDFQEMLFNALQYEGFLNKRDGRYSRTFWGDLFILKKFSKLICADVDTIVNNACDEKGYMTPEERTTFCLKKVSLEGYKCVGIDNDGKITFQAQVRNGGVTRYYYMYCDKGAIKDLISRKGKNNSISDIYDLVQNLTLYGYINRRFYKNEMFVVTDLEKLPESFLRRCLEVNLNGEKELDRLQKEREEREKENVDTNEDNRKKRMQANVIDEIKRVGPAVIDKDVVGDDFINAFGIRGGEFGNWVNDKERQLNMNYCFEAFSDIADVLGIPCSAVAIGHRLGIAFGARGSGIALAHYEPNREVINLTRLKGAGNLAHEYFHFIDDMIAKALGIRGLASDSENNCPEYMKNLVNCVKYKNITVSPEMHHQESVENYERHLEEFWTAINLFAPDNILTEEQIAEKKEIGNKLINMALRNIPFLTFDMSKNKTKTIINPVLDGLFDFMTKYSKSYKMVLQNRKYLASRIQAVADTYRNTLEVYEGSDRMVYTDYHNNACELNKSAVRAGHGYWNSNSEMLARAFACYVKDKLAENGRSNDYLCGQAEQEGEKGSLTYPVGLERKEINKAFDVLFEALRNEKFFKS